MESLRALVHIRAEETALRLHEVEDSVKTAAADVEATKASVAHVRLGICALMIRIAIIADQGGTLVAHLAPFFFIF